MSADLEGRIIVSFRPMTERELLEEGWELLAHQLPPPVIELDDGTIVFPSRDAAGNGPGCLFGKGPDGRSIRFDVQTRCGEQPPRVFPREQEVPSGDSNS